MGFPFAYFPKLLRAGPMMRQRTESTEGELVTQIPVPANETNILTTKVNKEDMGSLEFMTPRSVTDAREYSGDGRWRRLTPRNADKGLWTN